MIVVGNKTINEIYQKIAPVNEVFQRFFSVTPLECYQDEILQFNGAIPVENLVEIMEKSCLNRSKYNAMPYFRRLCWDYLEKNNLHGKYYKNKLSAISHLGRRAVLR